MQLVATLLTGSVTLMPWLRLCLWALGKCTGAGEISKETVGNSPLEQGGGRRV